MTKYIIYRGNASDNLWDNLLQWLSGIAFVINNFNLIHFHVSFRNEKFIKVETDNNILIEKIREYVRQYNIVVIEED